MIFYDYALGIGEEVGLFWPMPVLGPAWIFLANRYSLLVYGVACLLQVPRWTTSLVSTHTGQHICPLILHAVGVRHRVLSGFIY